MIASHSLIQTTMSMMELIWRLQKCVLKWMNGGMKEWRNGGMNETLFAIDKYWLGLIRNLLEWSVSKFLYTFRWLCVIGWNNNSLLSGDEWWTEASHYVHEKGSLKWKLNSKYVSRNFTSTSWNEVAEWLKCFSPILNSCLLSDNLQLTYWNCGNGRNEINKVLEVVDDWVTGEVRDAGKLERQNVVNTYLSIHQSPTLTN